MHSGEFMFSAIHSYVTNRTTCRSEFRPTSLRHEVAYHIIEQIALHSSLIELIKCMAESSR